MHPTIPGSTPIYRIQTQPSPTSPVEIDQETTDQGGPVIQVSRPSVTSMSSSIASSIDDDFIDWLGLVLILISSDVHLKQML